MGSAGVKVRHQLKARKGMLPWSKDSITSARTRSSNGAANRTIGCPLRDSAFQLCDEE